MPIGFLLVGTIGIVATALLFRERHQHSSPRDQSVDGLPGDLRVRRALNDLERGIGVADGDVTTDVPVTVNWVNQ